MELLKERILRDGKLQGHDIVNVSSFLNHQMDINLLNEIGKEFKRRFTDSAITKILTIESSGIGIACITAQYFHVPVIFAKKHEAKNLKQDVYESPVYSYTKDKPYRIKVAREFLKEDDCVLVIDDFLAHGQAAVGLLEIVEQSGSRLAGVGIVIEKAFQGGRAILERKGCRVESLAIIKSMKDGRIVFG